MKTDANVELFMELDASPIQRNGIILIPVSKVEQTIIKLLEKDLVILGFDAFKLYDDNRIQPFLEYSPDYSKGTINFGVIKNDLKKISPEITHIEIVIK